MSQWIDLSRMNVMPLKRTYKVHNFMNKKNILRGCSKKVLPGKRKGPRISYKHQTAQTNHTQLHTKQYSRTQHNTTQHNTTQHNTAQHNTT